MVARECRMKRIAKLEHCNGTRFKREDNDCLAVTSVGIKVRAPATVQRNAMQCNASNTRRSAHC